MESVVREFEIEKETKNTFRYKEVLEDDADFPVVGSLYIQKWAIKKLLGNGEVPRRLKVKIEVV